MDISLKVKNTKKDYMEFNKFHMLKRAFLFLAGVFLFSLVFGLFSYFNGNREFGAMFLTVAFVYPVIYYALSIIKVNIFLKKNPGIVKDVEIIYSFNENSIAAEINKGGEVNNTEINYDSIYEVYETRKYYYLYINKEQAFIMPKDSIIKGNSESLTKLIKGRLSKKNYKIITLM